MRPVGEADLPGVERLVDLFATGHPAAGHSRSRTTLRAAYLGPQRMAELLVAERGGTLVGMGQWRRIHDLFWGMFGAEGEWLFVAPGLRGLGIGAAIVAAICARAQAAGCEFLHGHAGDADVARLYARSAIESPGWSFSSVRRRSATSPRSTGSLRARSCAASRTPRGTGLGRDDRAPRMLIAGVEHGRDPPRRKCHR